MSERLKLIEITGSPNNIKVRIALGLKGLDYDREPLELGGFPGDRTSVIAASTQPRTPVLLHGETVIFDSGGILRYLDANFPDTPQLFSSDYFEMGIIEEWELWAKTALGEPVGTLFRQVFAQEVDLGLCRRAAEAMHEATGRIEQTLVERPFLLGESIKAPDVVCAPLVNLTMLPDSPDAGPIGRFFNAHFPLGEGREKTREWVQRTLAHDPFIGG